MAIYRGTGGSSTTTDETTINAVNQKAAEAATSASNAASSASSAATSASTANTKATQASTSATNAAASASSATQSANEASTSADAALAAQVAAELAETGAVGAESNAILFGNMANTAAADAVEARSFAEAANTSAQTYAAAALSSANDASSYDAAVQANATAAALSETNAAASEAAAATSATNAASSATAANASAVSAAASESSVAANATAAAASETNAAASESAAATSESNASGSATAAANSASAASASASGAATSATNAATSETAAASSASSASASADAALAALDSFDDRYLGQKTSDPTLDNDGNALVAGALYFNTTDDVMKVYEGSTWVAAYASLSGALLQNNNLSDVLNVATARTNLGLGTAATTASSDYATAAQGALADSALQSFTETDPVFSASEAASITSTDTTNWDTAYGWGDHGAAGYADDAAVTTALAGKLDTTHDMSLTLSGDVSGSATFTNMGNATLSVTVADDNHNHTIANVDGLQAALNGKVDDSQVLTNVPAGAVFTDTVYSHPTYAGDDINLDTGALSGATVISDLDFNVTTDTQGHVTDANATYSTRNLTAANIGAQPAGTYNTVIGTDADINTSGATIIDNLYMTDGVITSHGTRNLTLGDLGAGSLASLSAVGAAQITDNSVGAAELNVSGNGASGQLLTSDGDGSFSWTDAASGGGGITKIIKEVFTSSGTFTVPDTPNLLIICIGGGGGTNANFGGGGGGAGIVALVPREEIGAVGSTVSITVGAGGSGGGGSGGTTSFGSFITAGGGSGSGGNQVGGAGGQSSYTIDSSYIVEAGRGGNGATRYNASAATSFGAGGGAGGQSGSAGGAANNNAVQNNFPHITGTYCGNGGNRGSGGGNYGGGAGSNYSGYVSGRPGICYVVYS